MTTEQNRAGITVITGASSAIGEATARELSAAGYSVALLARRAERIEAIASELGKHAIEIAANRRARSRPRSSAAGPLWCVPPQVPP